MAWTIQGAPPEYCPWCGESLGARSHEGWDLPYCDSCERTLYRNPVPMGRATLVDGDSALLVARGRGSNVGEWALAGGHLDHQEPPAVGAARELAEETGLSIHPDDLTLLGTGFLRFQSGLTMVSIDYVGDVADATGTLEAGDDAVDARFWSREELVADPPQLRASGLEQVLRAIETVGEHRD
ncbi:NUDIX domain-containing protein [Halomarina oriensis]|uniref:NUDIX domain-containing protein n=1 Tax=Halomarina oriensis TaxID=671145 RepID=A0A6B0GLD3_9EURY|nr:NUDIX domain-containing protein [Halomarina oriensis]MWG35450.1 NUDIX domain-containing protein [Halomarina oriensis]